MPKYDTSLAESYVTGFQQGFTLVQNIQKLRQEKYIAEAKQQLEQAKFGQQAEQDNYTRAYNKAQTALQILGSTSLQNPHVKLSAFNSNVLPYLNMGRAPDQQLTPLTEWTDKEATLAKALLSTTKVAGTDLTPGERLQLMAEELAYHGRGSEALDLTGKAAALPQPSVEQQKFNLLTPEQQREAAQQSLQRDVQVISGWVTGEDGQSQEVKLERDPKTGLWNPVTTAGGQQVTGEPAEALANLKGLGDTAARFAMTINAQNAIQEVIIPTLFKGGQLHTLSLRDAGWWKTSAEGQKLATALSVVRAGILRPETGAAAVTQEQKDIAERLDPGFLMKNPETFQYSFSQAIDFLRMTERAIDPQGLHRKNVEAYLKSGKTIEMMIQELEADAKKTQAPDVQTEIEGLADDLLKGMAK